MPKKVYKNKECRFCHGDFVMGAGESVELGMRTTIDKMGCIEKTYNQIKCNRCGKWSRWYRVR